MNDPAPDTDLEVKAEYLFAIVPEWVLYANISAHAVRLYAVLNRYAQGKGECYPSRKRLAGHLAVSKDTIDRALDDLVELGAIEVTKRQTERGEWRSNLYLVRTTPPKGVAAPMPPPSRTRAHTVAAPVPTEREPIEREKLKGTRSRSASPAATEAERIAKAWWDRQEVKPAGARAWHSLKNSITAVVERGWKATDILDALDRIAAVPSVAQLDRELRKPRVESWAERKAREEREAKERAKARAEEERRATEERLRKADEDRAKAVPMPEEVRERLRALRGERAS